MHDIPSEEDLSLNDDSAQELSADEEKLLDELGDAHSELASEVIDS